MGFFDSEIDLSLRSTVFVMKDKDGVRRQYKIQDFSGTAREEYLNDLKARSILTKDGSMRLKSFKGSCSPLLIRSMFVRDLKEDGTPNEDGPWASVTANFVDSLPSSVQVKLFEEARRTCGLGDDEDDEGN